MMLVFVLLSTQLLDPVREVSGTLLLTGRHTMVFLRNDVARGPWIVITRSVNNSLSWGGRWGGVVGADRLQACTARKL